jgi:hypothetical protein
MSILIAAAAYNRFKITELCLLQIMKYKRPEDKLLVCNDHSTEYTHDQLLPLADEVITLPNKSKNGPTSIRWYQMERFLESDHAFLYFADNDGFHDPKFINILLTFYSKVGSNNLPVCLYNSYYHNSPENIVLNKQGISLKKTAPGISMLFNKEMIKTILSRVQKSPKEHSAYDWDYRACSYLERLFVTSNTSYVEHFGFGGMHYSKNNNDIAQSPSAYLKKHRQTIIDYLEKNVELPQELQQSCPTT